MYNQNRPGGVSSDTSADSTSMAGSALPPPPPAAAPYGTAPLDTSNYYGGDGQLPRARPGFAGGNGNGFDPMPAGSDAGATPSDHAGTPGNVPAPTKKRKSNAAAGSNGTPRSKPRTSTTDLGDKSADMSHSRDASKVRKVVVTSCDACRARKLRCNSKELPLGEGCSNCVRSKIPCSFDYCADTTGGTIRLRNRVAELDSGISGAAMAAAGGLAQLAGLAAASGGPNGGSWSAYKGGPFGGIEPEMFRYANEDPSTWGVPLIITNPATGVQATYALPGVLDTLMARFFEHGTLATMIMFKEESMARYRSLAHSTLQQTSQSGHPDGPLPAYLTLAMLSCAAISSVTSEPELIEWGKTIGWQLALRGVQRRLSLEGAADLDLVQAITLVGACWCGDNPNSQERIALFETAFRLAYDLNLTSSLDYDRLQPDIRAKRIVIFWVLYALDKTLALICRRPSQLNSDLHSIPKLTLTDVVLASTKGSPRVNDQPEPRASDEEQWTCRLLEAFISLASIFERTSLPMVERRAMASLTFRAMQNQISAVEGELEEWCQNHGELLSSATLEGQVFQGTAESLVAILHVAQLQLYSPALRYEARQATKIPLKFSDGNNKALTACIESAWHLIQQPESKFALAGPGDQTNLGPIASSITSLGVVRATQFLRFLSTHWADWRQGYGMHDRLPNATMNQPQPDANAQLDPAIGALPNEASIGAANGNKGAGNSPMAPPAARNRGDAGTPVSQQWGAPPAAPGSAGVGGRKGRKSAPAPLDFASPSNTVTSDATASVADVDAPQRDEAPQMNLVQPSPTTPARFLFEMPKTAGLSAWANMPGAMGAMMTPLRPDFLGGLDLNIPWDS